MKKIVITSLFLISTPLFAATYDQLLIKITNSLSTDCKLKDQTILFGHVSDHTRIPQVISANQTLSFKMRPGPTPRAGIYKDQSFLITYVCDGEQEITLYGSQNMSIEAKRFDVKNMWATFEIKAPLFAPSEIDWTLTY